MRGAELFVVMEGDHDVGGRLSCPEFAALRTAA